MTGSAAAAAPVRPAGATGPAGAAGWRRRRLRHRLRVLAFLSPWLVGVGLFLGYPLVAVVYFSFTRYDLLSAPHWAGLTNYAFLFGKDTKAWQAMRNTLWLVAVMVPARVLFGLGVALLLARIRAGAGVFRLLCYLPYLVPPVAGTIAFVFLFNPGTGPVNQAIAATGIDPPRWFSDPSWAKPALVLLALWGIGDVMIIMLASLLDVPAQLYESAALDGANAWQRFRHVTLPMLSPVLLFAAVTGVIQTLQYFTQAVVAANVASGQTDLPGGHGQIVPGYPAGATLTYQQWIYEMGFRQFDIGYACALAVLLFVIALGVTVLLLRRASGFTPREGT